MNEDEPPRLDVERILTTLDRHGVEYLLVGGISANAYGARRLTKDFDCLPTRTDDNLQRLAAAMVDLNARLRVEGLGDDEASQLPVQLDQVTLSAMEISTWRTDAGDLDVLSDIPDREGRRRRYEDLAPRSTEALIGKVTVRLAALDDVIASKEWANRPKDREALGELRELRRVDESSDALRDDSSTETRSQRPASPDPHTPTPPGLER